MRIAVLSDVHANYRAFTAIADEAARTGADELWCLGDLVGLGFEPADTVAAVRDTCTVILAGNHDAVVAGADNVSALGELDSPAVLGALRAIEALEATGDLRWLRTLPTTAQRHGICCAHGSLVDPMWGYVDSPATAAQSLDRLDQALLLVGHTHQPGAHFRSCADPTVVQTGSSHLSLSGRRAVLNPGAAGCAQRDGRPPGSWLLIDTAAQTARWQSLVTAS